MVRSGLLASRDTSGRNKSVVLGYNEVTPGAQICACLDPYCGFEECWEIIRQNMYINRTLELYRTYCDRIKRSHNPEVTCNQVVTWLLNVHRCHVFETGRCNMAEEHDMLFIATRLAVKFRLRRCKTVTALLKDIFRCEGNFDKIVLGAIYGSSAISGYQFESRRECFRVFQRFVQYAMRSRLMFYYNKKFYKIVDIPLKSGESPLSASEKSLKGVEVYDLLCKYGAFETNEELEFSVEKEERGL